jgi:hypothetical protein
MAVKYLLTITDGAGAFVGRIDLHLFDMRRAEVRARLLAAIEDAINDDQAAGDMSEPFCTCGRRLSQCDSTGTLCLVNAAPALPDLVQHLAKIDPTVAQGRIDMGSACALEPWCVRQAGHDGPCSPTF